MICDKLVEVKIVKIRNITDVLVIIKDIIDNHNKKSYTLDMRNINEIGSSDLFLINKLKDLANSNKVNIKINASKKIENLIK